MSRTTPIALASLLTLSACMIPGIVPGDGPSAPVVAPPVSVSQVIGYVDLLDQTAVAVVAGLRGTALVSAADLDKADAISKGLHVVLAQLRDDTAGVNTASRAKQAIVLVQSLAPIAEKYFRVSTEQRVLIDAAVAITPLVLSAVGIVSAAPSHTSMSAAHGLAVLRGRFART